MHYKPKLKLEASKSRSKQKYKVVNWTEYNKSLKKRGELSFYFPKGDLKALFINENPYVPGLSGLDFPRKVGHTIMKQCSTDGGYKYDTQTKNIY